MRAALCWLVLAACALPAAPAAGQRKLTKDQRIELIRGLMAEFATAAVPVPRSKKPLVIQSNGAYDKDQWESIGRFEGQAARAGDTVQVTKIELSNDRIVLELNFGAKGGPKWYERIEVGTGTRTTSIGGPDSANRPAPGGPTLALLLPEDLAGIDSTAVKKVLEPVLRFSRRKPDETYVDSLPEPLKQAIREKRAIEGMNRDQVLLALGKPDRKVRETVEDEELEDWIYGRPPGRITFVTFAGEKVLRVRESYAGLGGATADPLPPPR